MYSKFVDNLPESSTIDLLEKSFWPTLLELILKKAAYGENKSIKVVYRHSLATVGNWSERLNRIGFDVFQRKITTQTFFVTCFFPSAWLKNNCKCFSDVQRVSQLVIPLILKQLIKIIFHLQSKVHVQSSFLASWIHQWGNNVHFTSALNTL